MRRNLDLIELMRDQFVLSKRLQRVSILCNIGVVAISLSTSVSVFRVANVYLLISLLLVQFGAYVLRQLSINYFSEAESIRSAVMLRDGLGLAISESQLTRLTQSLNPSDVQEPPFLTPYYASQMPPGPGTLLLLLAESCSYSKDIARRSFKILSTVITTTVPGVVILISLIRNAYATNSVLVNVNMSVLTLLSIWATLDLATMSMRYRKLQHGCSLIRSKCLGLQTANTNMLDEIMHLVNEYTRALAESSPFPIKFCEAHKAHLNQFWPALSHLEDKIFLTSS